MMSKCNGMVLINIAIYKIKLKIINVTIAYVILDYT